MNVSFRTNISQKVTINPDRVVSLSCEELDSTSSKLTINGTSYIVTRNDGERLYTEIKYLMGVNK